MTIPPRVTKYRIRRSSNTAAKPAIPEDVVRPDPRAADNGDQSPTTAEQDILLLDDSARVDADEIAKIKAEGLTGRQLRNARRLAIKNGIQVEDDYEAVYQLRRRGIDPLQPAAVLQLIDKEKPQEIGRIQLPQTVPDSSQVPAISVPGAQNEQFVRGSEIMQIQRDIVRRRRRNFFLLLARLAVFVFLPTAMAGWYYYKMATPLFATRSEFIIQQQESVAAGGIGGMFKGTQFATSQDSIAVQGYLQSRDAMLRLDKDLGFKAHFSQDFIDPIQRLEANSSNEAAYRLYQRNVKIGYDPTEGLIKMEVIAADPQVSENFSKALIGYAEEQVDQLSSRLREDQMKGARESYEDAETKMEAAQQKVLELQESLGIFDPASESSTIMNQVNGFEVELQKKRLELQQLLDNARPNQARVDGAKGDISRLEALIANLRSQLTSNTSGSTSLAQVSGQLRIAEADLETRQMMLAQALQQLEVARIEANRQVRYLAPSVSPVAPDEPTYPRAFENTLLAFLIFGGIYLMLSLTASILREQATS